MSLSEPPAYMTKKDAASSISQTGVASGINDNEKQWVFRKVDTTLLLVLTLSSLLNSMDRSNLGLSKVAGLEKDTEMAGSDFNVVTSIIYPTYLLFMLPSNLALRKFGARIWLSLITVAWGIANMCMAFAKNRTDLILCRLFLGAAESGASPGALMLITLWYPRHMVTSRISMFYSAFAAGAIIGGPVASAIMKIGNPLFKNWGWIFFIEGLLTVGFGLLMFLLLADYPEQCWYFTKQERELLRHCMEEEQAEGGHRPVNVRRLWAHAFDPLLYAQALIMFCMGFGGNTILIFGATIVNQMGYSVGTAQAMQAAPGLCGFVGIIVSRYYPTWFRSHYAGSMFCSSWIISASIILLAVSKKEVLVFALCALSFGTFGNTAIGPGWVLSNSGGPTRSAIGSVLNVAAVGLGGFCTSYIYRNKDQPRYLVGHGVNLFAGLLAALTATVSYAIIKYRNKLKVEAPIDLTQMSVDQIIDLENDHPDFRYVE